MATGDSIDEEDRPFIGAELSEKRAAPLGMKSFNRVMGFVNVVLALVLAVSLALLTISVTHDRNDAAVVASGPYCKCFHYPQQLDIRLIDARRMKSSCEPCATARDEKVQAEPDLSERRSRSRRSCVERYPRPRHGLRCSGRGRHGEALRTARTADRRQSMGT